MHPHLYRSIAIAFLAALLHGCASNPAGDANAGVAGRDGSSPGSIERLGPDEAEPWDPALLADKRRAGMMLADLDRQMQAWNGIVLGGQEKDIRRVDLLEDSIKNDVRRHLPEIVHQLETGPVMNRQIAAAALGFSDVPKSLGPLLAALEDPNDVVVANALLGISALRAPQTPVGGILEKFGRTDAPLAVRANAGRALRSIDLNGLEEADRTLVIDAARAALSADEPPVRVLGALILAKLVDSTAISRLAICLDDEAPIVGQAASRAIAHIGSTDSHVEGTATRALAAAIRRVKHREVKAEIFANLQLLSKRNYGENADDWLEYANRLP